MNRSMIAVPKLRFSEPRRNLPGRRGIATAEDRFTIAFMQAYHAQMATIHRKSKRTHLAFAREIPVNGYGIADLVIIAWEALLDEQFPSADAFVSVARPCTRAFEFKLDDWRQGMSQAARYRFFAHQAVMVLPERTCETALRFLNTFKKIGVGLWSFAPETDRIVVHYTPRATTPKSERYHIHAVDRVASATTRALPIAQRG